MTVAEHAAENVASVVEGAIEGVVAATESALVSAEARAEAAEQVAALVAEAAVQRTITDDVDDLREEIETWQSELNQLRTTLETGLAEIRSSLTAFLTMEVLTVELAKLSSQPSPLTRSNSNPTQEATSQEAATNNPSDAAGEGHPAADQEPKPKPKRFHLT